MSLSGASFGAICDGWLGIVFVKPLCFICRKESSTTSTTLDEAATKTAFVSTGLSAGS
jgi:hypothetical protein